DNAWVVIIRHSKLHQRQSLLKINSEHVLLPRVRYLCGLGMEPQPATTVQETVAQQTVAQQTVAQETVAQETTVQETTTIKGVEVQPQASTTPEYKSYNSKLGGKLVKLYKITYEENTPNGSRTSGWSQAIYFHGTGHCGCVDTRATTSGLRKIKTRNWCRNKRCATRGILNHGHLLRRSPGGHFFSPNASTAWGYAASKSAPHQHLPLFICKARGSFHHGDICAVQDDSRSSDPEPRVRSNLVVKPVPASGSSVAKCSNLLMMSILNVPSAINPMKVPNDCAIGFTRKFIWQRLKCMWYIAKSILVIGHRTFLTQISTAKLGVISGSSILEDVIQSTLYSEG
ncbi:MAG: hypothetical protein J3Q66DRAFT_429156, partial [Benniella sp.]